MLLLSGYGSCGACRLSCCLRRTVCLKPCFSAQVRDELLQVREHLFGETDDKSWCLRHLDGDSDWFAVGALKLPHWLLLALLSGVGVLLLDCIVYGLWVDFIAIVV